jgi:hypothetical protein
MIKLETINPSQMSTTRLKIAKLSGVTDAEHIEKALEAVPRVASVKLDPRSTRPWSNMTAPIWTNSNQP